MNWFEKLVPSKILTKDKKNIPDGLWTKCAKCEETIYTQELQANKNVCSKCSHHFRISARKRLDYFFDKNSSSEIATELRPIDKLKFKDSKKYKDRINEAQKKTGEKDALILFSGKLKGENIVAAAFEFNFMGGSMGSVVGEKFVRGVEKAIELNSPFICFAASGGARMQEGLISLMQMAKTSAALSRLSAKKLPFISFLTDPTMGGVSASFAMLGDLIVAEPKALIGFAGPRVIEQTVRETLPEGFQRSEFLLEKGAIDMIIDRRDIRSKLSSVLSKLMNYQQPDLVEASSAVLEKDNKEVDVETNQEETLIKETVE